jgi:cell division septum initiation protein DivIVA
VTDQFDDFDEQLREPPREPDAEALVRQAIDVVSMAKPMPLSSSVLISRDEVLDLLEGALDRLPEELRQARWLLREREDFLAEQQRDADQLMEEVKAQAERMVSRTELVRQARATAQQIIEEAEELARRMRHEAEDYCDQKLAGMEIVLNRVLKTVSAGRERLQPQLEEVQEAEHDELMEAGDEVFFDQDQL